METVSNIIIFIGVGFILFGVIGIFKFKDFYPRVLVSSKIDTVGMMTITAGLIIKHGVSFFSLKLLILLVILITINPLAAHFTARSAYMSGYGGVKNENDTESAGVPPASVRAKSPNS